MDNHHQQRYRSHYTCHSHHPFQPYHSLGASLGTSLTKDGHFDVEADYQRDRWYGDTQSELNDLDAIGVSTELSYRFRSLRFAIDARLSRVNRHGQQEERERVFLSVRRDFR